MLFNFLTGGYFQFLWYHCSKDPTFLHMARP